VPVAVEGGRTTDAGQPWRERKGNRRAQGGRNVGVVGSMAYDGD
jgi:hypothetical protein